MKGKSRSLISVYFFLTELGGIGVGWIGFGLVLEIFFLSPPLFVRAPLSVNLKARNLAKELQKHIQGTTLPVTNKGCC